MNHKTLHPSDLIARCLLMQRDTYWVAMCIDLDLAVQASSAVEAQKLLREQMISYVSEAIEIDQAHAAELLHRRAPVGYFVMYYVAKLLSVTKKHQSYESAMPMAPVHA